MDDVQEGMLKLAMLKEALIEFDIKKVLIAEKIVCGQPSIVDDYYQMSGEGGYMRHICEAVIEMDDDSEVVTEAKRRAEAWLSKFGSLPYYELRTVTEKP